VVTQAGLPFEMPWLTSVSTLIHAWYGGQETGHAIADVLFGNVNPSGKLSITFPKKLEDNPAFLTFGKQDRVLVYGEGVFVGHRYYEKLKREPLFYFGYGLSYTEFKQTNFVLPDVYEANEDTILAVSVDVENVGKTAGAEVVQLYVSDIECSVQRPRKELKAFTMLYLEKSEKRTVHLKLDKYAVSFWSEELEEWKVEAGDFEVIICKSSDPKDEILKARFKVPKTFSWTGL
jgi:beta-glucosidase